MTSDDIARVETACAASGHTPVGATVRDRLTDACSFVAANAAPPGEEELWERAQESCSIVQTFLAVPI